MELNQEERQRYYNQEQLHGAELWVSSHCPVNVLGYYIYELLTFYSIYKKVFGILHMPLAQHILLPSRSQP